MAIPKVSTFFGDERSSNLPINGANSVPITKADEKAKEISVLSPFAMAMERSSKKIPLEYE